MESGRWAQRTAGAHEAALRTYRHAATLPDFAAKRANVLVLAGSEALVAGEDELALDLLNQALRLDDANTEARLHKARALLKLGRAGEALATLEEAQQLMGPEHYWLQLLKGHSYDALERQEEAIEAYQQALALRPETANLYYFIGQAYQKLGAQERARRWYQDYLDHAPDGIFAEQAQAFLLPEENAR